MLEADPLRIVEAAYQWPGSNASWLCDIAEAAKPYSAGAGIVLCSVRCREAVEVAQTALAGEARDDHAAAIRSYCSGLPPALGSLLLGPTEFVGNAHFRLERLAREKGCSVEQLSRGERLPALWAVIAGNPREQAVLLAIPAADPGTSSTAPFPNKGGRLLGLVAAHIGAALRLRALASASDGNEAVLSPHGTILHAEGEAREHAARESLAEAVLRSERARGRLRCAEPAEAMRMWQALVDGRWSIVETTERDGKRLLIARRNPLNAPDLLQLSKEESAVVWLATQGHSYKYMAYQLGISTSAVTRRLAPALKKLRVGSRRELLRRLGNSPLT